MTFSNSQIDALRIREKSLPQEEMERLIANHCNSVVESYDVCTEWRQGEINPRVRYITDYINDMFSVIKHMDNVVSYNDTENVYSYHFSFTNRDPAGSMALSALSLLTYASDVVRGETNGRIATSYLCEVVELEYETAA